MYIICMYGGDDMQSRSRAVYDEEKEKKRSECPRKDDAGHIGMQATEKETLCACSGDSQDAEKVVVIILCLLPFSGSLRRDDDLTPVLWNRCELLRPSGVGRCWTRISGSNGAIGRAGYSGDITRDS